MDKLINVEADLINKMNAFFYFKTEGAHTAERIFPELIEFVLDNKHRTWEEVKEDLLSQMPDVGGNKKVE